MAIIEIHSTPTHKSLMNKTKSDLAGEVLRLISDYARLKKDMVEARKTVDQACRRLYDLNRPELAYTINDSVEIVLGDVNSKLSVWLSDMRMKYGEIPTPPARPIDPNHPLIRQAKRKEQQ